MLSEYSYIVFVILIASPMRLESKVSYFIVFNVFPFESLEDYLGDYSRISARALRG